MFKLYGHHYIVEVYGVDQMKLNDVDFFHNMFHEQQKLQKSTQLEFHYHKFNPIGLSQILILQESHISVHTFPEDTYQQIDLFTCTDDNPRPQIDYMIKELNPEFYDIKYIKRGIPQVFNMGNEMKYKTFNERIFKQQNLTVSDSNFRR